MLRLLENSGLIPRPAGYDAVSGWYPINDAQNTFINCRAQMALYGGQSGGGKSNVLVADSAQEFDNPYFRGIILRKSYTELTNMMDEMERIYRPLGGRPADGRKIWKFPAGGQMRLGYMANDKHLELYTGKPISFLGIDEAQFQTEDRVRTLIPWVATPREYGLRDRIRLTANPSTPWLMSLFLNNHCPLCYPHKSTIPCAIYEGARWKKDDGPVMLTTCFIPAKLKDNPLYDEAKAAKLQSQTADVRRKLLDGCWCNTEGAFFPFLNESYILPYRDCGEQWWHTHFLSMDYGYSNSAAATGLYFMNESGRIYKVDEDVTRIMKSEEYAHHIVNRMVLRKLGGERVRIVSGYADYAMDAHTGTGQSNLDLINAVMNKFDVHLIKGAKDPIGSAQLLSGKLERGEYVITDNCPKTFECLTSRRNDPDMPGSILKVPGDELDDVKDTDLYGINNFCQGSKKPAEVATQEKLKELRDQGVNDMSLNVIRWKMEKEAAKQAAPVSMGRPTIGSAGRIIRR